MTYTIWGFLVFGSIIFVLVPLLLFYGMIFFLGIESVHYGFSKKMSFIENVHLFIKQQVLALQNGHWNLHH